MGFALPRISWRERTPDNDPAGVIPAKLPRAIDQIGWAFTWGCIGFLLYFTWSAAGNKAVALEIDQFLWWRDLGIKLWLPLVVPYTIISVAVPILVKFGLPMFMQFQWGAPRQSWPKGWSAVLVVGGSLVIIAGSFVVQNDARLEQNRTGAVQVQQAAANKAAVDAEIGELRNQLRVLTEDGQSRPTIEAKAAREGAAGWPAKITEAEAQEAAGRPVDVDRFRRAKSAAIAADSLRDKITSKIGEKAAMPTEAAVAKRVVEEGDSATAFVDFVKQWRSLLLALISDLGALFCTWLAMRLMDIRAQQLADWEAVHAAPVAEAGVDLRLEDQTDTAQPMPQESIWEEDPVTGELVEKIRMRRKKEEWFVTKTPRKLRKPKTDPRAPVANEVEEYNGPTDEMADLPAPTDKTSVEGLQLGDAARPAATEATESESLDVEAPELSGEMVSSSEGRLDEDSTEASVTLAQMETELPERSFGPEHLEDELREAASTGQEFDPSAGEFILDEADAMDASDEAKHSGELLYREDVAETDLADVATDTESEIAPDLVEPRERTEDEIAELERQWAEQRSIKLPTPNEAAE